MTVGTCSPIGYGNQMSVTRETSIHCDNCGEWCGGQEWWNNATQIRKQIHKRGWRTLPGGKDLCPDCSEVRK